MTEIKRKEGENFESYLRRFNKSLIKSRKLKEVRRRQYLSKKTNKNKQKEQALKCKKMKENKEYLIKTGKLKEENRGNW